MRPPPSSIPAIGVLDSGVGGLSILREIHRLLPDNPTIYFADQKHLPYGPRPADEIRRFVEAIADFLIRRGAAVIVIACNAASAASLHDLRARYPHIPFVGMEPAVKPAAEATQTGVIGVLTTQATANGELYRRVQERFTTNVKVITQVAPELVTMVEQGSADMEESQHIIRGYVQPMLDAGADQIVLACTHFPFLKEMLAAIANVPLIDPSEAVARQVARVLPSQEVDGKSRGGAVWRPSRTAPTTLPENRYFTSGDPERLKMMLKRLIGVEEAQVNGVRWDGNEII